MVDIHSFAPVAGAAPHSLILGSMPGARSLAENRYYAHPRNQFWPIMARLLEFDSEASYENRLLALTGAGFALWDVIAACHRPGSLDSSIVPDSIVPNDFNQFLSRHSSIEVVYFNGGRAEQEFRRRVLPELGQDIIQRIRLTRLPSTSPAHAAMSFDKKLDVWDLCLKGFAKHRRQGCRR